MASRRSRFDPLATTDRPLWLVVKDMYGAVLAGSQIAAVVNLHDLMAATIMTRQADGWTVDNDGSYGFAFCHKAAVRRMVAIVQVDPEGEPSVGVYTPQPPVAARANL